MTEALEHELLDEVEKARLEVPHTPVIGCCLSARTNRVKAAGAASYLVKPVDRDRLSAAIASLDVPVKSILVVDDEADTRMLLSMLLGTLESDFEIVTAATGSEALQTLKACHPDLMLLDVYMPGIFLEQKLLQVYIHNYCISREPFRLF